MMEATAERTEVPAPAGHRAAIRSPRPSALATASAAGPADAEGSGPDDPAAVDAASVPAAPAEGGSARWRPVALVLLAGVALPVLAAALGGGLGIARNDDYAFSASAWALARDGRFRLLGPADMVLVGQLWASWPVARLTTSRTALQLLTVGVGAVGLLATAALGRHVLTARRAALAAVAVALTPMWAPLAASSMTDVWAVALTVLAAALTVRAADAERSTGGFLVAAAGAVLVASWAFSVRQTAASALAIVAVGLVVALATSRKRSPQRRTERAAVAVLVGLAASGAGALYRWRSARPLGGASAASSSLDALTLPLVNLDRTLLTLGLVLLPATVLLVRPTLLAARVRARPRLAVGLGAAIGALLVVRLAQFPLERLTLVDYASRFGPASLQAPQRLLPIVPDAAWTLVLVAAAANVWALALVLADGWPRRAWRAQPVLLAVLVVGLLAGAAMFAGAWVASLRTFDRYLLPLVPFAAVLVGWVGELAPAEQPAPRTAERGAETIVRRTAVARGVAVVGVVALAAWFALASAAFDRAAHDAAAAAARATGRPAIEVDGGMTWNGVANAQAYGADGSWTPDAPRATRCVVVRQGASRAEAEAQGTVVLHRRTLWVDRWFAVAPVVPAPPGC